MISNSIAHNLASFSDVEMHQGYVNATSICKTFNKRWPDYYRLSSTKACISRLAKELGLSKHKLIITTVGGTPNLQGTWIHPFLAVPLTNWCNSLPDEKEKSFITKQEPISVHPLSEKDIPISTKESISYTLLDYVNATSICKVVNKEWYAYYKQRSAKNKVASLAKELNLPISKVVVSIQGGLCKNQGTWIHPLLVPDFNAWCTASPNLQRERIIQANFPEEGLREVVCPAGKIDILTQEEIIEIKLAENWIVAIGQLIVYGSYYPNHKKRLHLFGDISLRLRSIIEKQCKELNIRVTYEM